MQHNTVTGLIAKIAGANLTDKENHLVKLNSSGQVVLTTAASDTVFGVIVSGAASGESADILPVNPGVQINVKVSASVTAGALIQLDGSNNGQALTATTGKAVAVAETSSSSGICKLRFLCGVRLPTTVVALTSTNGTAAAASANLSGLAAETEKIGDDLRAIHAALVTAGIVSAS